MNRDKIIEDMADILILKCGVLKYYPKNTPTSDALQKTNQTNAVDLSIELIGLDKTNNTRAE